MIRVFVGTRVVCCGVVAVCRRVRRVHAVAPDVSGRGVVTVGYSTDALATREVL